MEQKEQYSFEELCNNLEISMSAFSKEARVDEGTIARIRRGFPARRSTVNKLVKAFAQIYGVKISAENVTGITLQGVTTTVVINNPPTPAKSMEDDSAQPETPQISIVEPSSGMVRLTDFAEITEIPLRTLHYWREKGKIEAVQQNRPHGGGIEYFLTPEQQEKARLINSLRTPRKKQ